MSTKRFHEIASDLASSGQIDRIEVRNIQAGSFWHSFGEKKLTISPLLFTELQLEAGGAFESIYGIPVVYE